jgi:hypothetical protein
MKCQKFALIVPNSRRYLLWVFKYLKIKKDFVEIKTYYKKHFHFVEKSKNIILIEGYQVPSNELTILHFLKVLSKKIEFTPILFHSSNQNFLKKLSLQLEFKSSPIYAAGVKKIIFINTSIRKTAKIKKRAVEAISQLGTLEDFQKLQIGNLDVGDIFYDHFLRNFNYHTISLVDHRAELIELFEKFIYIYEVFSNLIVRNKVKAIFVSHVSYWHAIPARLGILNDIDVYQSTGESLYRVNREHPFAYTDFLNYKKVFCNLSQDKKNRGVIEAKKRLDQRFSGVPGVDMPYSSKSAFSSLYDTKLRILNETTKKKILVAVHDFYDSPHPFGWNFHIDIYQWLLDLKNISKLVDYEFYLKTHPVVLGNGRAILSEFADGTDNFFIVDPNVSHHQLIKEGIDCVLTVFGTVASEYPYFGIPVINASINNPHVAYDFSITPTSIQNYWDYLLNLDSLPTTIDKKQILEYYFMHNIYPIKSLLFYDYDKYLNDIGGYENSMSGKVYGIYLSSTNTRNLNELYRAFNSFIESDDQRLGPTHFETQ